MKGSSPRSRSHHYQFNSLCYNFVFFHALDLDPWGLLRAHGPWLKTQQLFLTLHMSRLWRACAWRPAELNSQPCTLLVFPQGIRDAHWKRCSVLCFLMWSHLFQQWESRRHSSFLSGISEVLGCQNPPKEHYCLSFPSHTLLLF